MTNYILALVFAGVMILLSAIIAVLIQYRTDTSDRGKRKVWFWIIGILSPVLFYLLGAFVLAPKAEDDQIVFDEYMAALPIATAVCFVVYLVVGFVLAKIFKNGKVGHWF